MTQLRKVALVIDSLRGGGAENNTRKLANHLAATGTEVHVICTERRQVHYAVDPRVRVHELSSSRRITGMKLLDRWILACRLRRLVGRLGGRGSFDLFVSHMRRADLVARLSGVEGVHYSIRNTLSMQLRERRRWQAALHRRQLRWVYDGQRLLTVSEGVKRDLLDVVGIRPRSVDVVYNPFDVSEIRTLAAAGGSDVEERKPYLVNVAGFKRQKRHDVLLRAFALARVPHRLVLVGGASDAERAELETLAASLGVADRLVFAGWQDNVFRWMRGADLFVLSSDYEGLPTVVIEALACGTPVVSTDCPSGPAEILLGPLARGLAPVGSPEGLARKIEEILRDPPEVTDTVLERFTFKGIVERLGALQGRGTA